MMLHPAVWSQTPQAQSSCPSKPDWYLKVEKPDTGWSIGIIDRDRKLGVAGHSMTSDPAFKEVLVTEYVLRGHYFPFTEVVVDACEHRASLRTQHLKVEHAYGYSIHGKTFAFVLSGNCGRLEKGQWIAAGCDTFITVWDTNGQGKFDQLRIGVSKPDSIPNWASRTSKPLIVHE
jgi:hypothetical protein